MVSLLVLNYAILYFFAQSQQQVEMSVFINDVASHLNRKIDNGETSFNQLAITPAAEIQNYQLLVFTPDNQVITLQRTQVGYEFGLPTWKPSREKLRQTYYHVGGFEAWYPLHNDHRLYVHVKYDTLLKSFNHPIYGLPILWVFCLLSLLSIYLRKRQQNWQELTEYLQQLPQTLTTGYQSFKSTQSFPPPEVRHISQLINRLSYKMTQYFEQYNASFYQQNALLNNAPVALFLISRKGKLLYFNQKFANLFATPFDANIVYMLSDFITASDKQTQQRLNNLKEYRVLGNLPVTNLQHDINFDLYLTPFYNRFGRLKGFSGALQVVTHYHDKLQKAWLDDKQHHDKIANFDKLWAVLGHELRTPLSGMIGMIDLLNEDKNQLNQEQQEAVTTLEQSSKTMLQLLNDMLDMAKLDAGKLQSNITSVNLAQLLRQVAELMIGNARRSHISLYIVTDPMIPHYFDSDDGRLRQILLNLMSNAVKFTKQGYVALLVDKLTCEHSIIQQKMAGKSADMATYWLRITVKDTGIGILPNDQKKLFSYFNQANDSISQQFGGTGLGLAISKNFSQMLGGFIHLESEAGQGSEFQVYLPMQKFSLQLAFDFRMKHLNVFLIIISPFSIIKLFQRFLDYYELTGMVVTEMNTATIKRLNTINFLDLMPIFVVDDAGYVGNEAWFSQINSFKNSKKIIASMESERSLDPDLLMQFDGFLPKPVTVTTLLAEVSQLYHQNSHNRQSLSNLPAPVAFRQFLQQYQQNANETDSVIHDKPVSDLTRTGLNSTNASSQQKVILLAEDNPVNQKIALKHLDNLGYNVLVADNGQRAIEILNQYRNDIGLILMDCRMPIFDGLEATRIIRANKDSIPIIALTANDTDDDRQTCIAAGMDNFLTKPIHRDSLATLIKRYLV